MDVVSASVRSRMMAGIKGKNTKPELLVRRCLHKRGVRYRLHIKHLPGKPDLVLRKFNAAIFIHGCFWHGHNCRLFKWPNTRAAFWQRKIGLNRERDLRQLTSLHDLGWRVCIIWECALRGSDKNVEKICEDVADWLHSSSKKKEIRDEARIPV